MAGMDKDRCRDATSRYRKKPVVIEAMQFSKYNRAEVMAWCGATKDAQTYHLGILGFCIPTLEDGDGEGQHIALVGDWIIKGVKGEFYPCKPDIFDATYEPESVASEIALKPHPASCCALPKPCGAINCTHPSLVPSAAGSEIALLPGLKEAERVASARPDAYEAVLERIAEIEGTITTGGEACYPRLAASAPTNPAAKSARECPSSPTPSSSLSAVARILPDEPTEEMLDAGAEAYFATKGQHPPKGPDMATLLRASYKAMVAAAWHPSSVPSSAALMPEGWSAWRTAHVPPKIAIKGPDGRTVFLDMTDNPVEFGLADALLSARNAERRTEDGGQWVGDKEHWSSARPAARLITEPMVEAAAQRMVALVMSHIIEKPQIVQWQPWAGSARAILEAAFEAGPSVPSATERMAAIDEPLPGGGYKRWTAAELKVAQRGAQRWQNVPVACHNLGFNFIDLQAEIDRLISAADRTATDG